MYLFMISPVVLRPDLGLADCSTRVAGVPMAAARRQICAVCLFVQSRSAVCSIYETTILASGAAGVQSLPCAVKKREKRRARCVSLLGAPADTLHTHTHTLYIYTTSAPTSLQPYTHTHVPRSRVKGKQVNSQDTPKIIKVALRNQLHHLSLLRAPNEVGRSTEVVGPLLWIPP